MIIVKSQGARSKRVPKKYYTAYKAQQRRQKQFPANKYGRMYVPRTAETASRYGLTWKGATPDQQAARREAHYYGQGDYRSALRAGARVIGAGVGAYGAFRGGRNVIAGATAGYAAGARLSRYAGWGDYGAPVTNQIMEGGNPPLTVNPVGDLSGDVVLSHTEFMQNIVVNGTGGSSSPFENRVFELNAGLTATFPWLSQIAQNFTMYEFVGLIFEYRPTSGEFGSSSNALGKVVMATNYDNSAPEFTTSVQAENYDYANSCKPSIMMRHGIETAERQMPVNMLYVRTGKSDRDKAFTDYGKFQMMSEGIFLGGTGAQSAIIGELWVTYQVRLSRAQLYGSLLGNNIDSDAFIGSALGTPLGGTTIDWNTMNTQNYILPQLANRAGDRKTNTIGGVFEGTSLTDLIYKFPTNIVDGCYELTLYITEPSPASGAVLTAGALVNCARTNFKYSNGGTTFAVNSTVTRLHQQIVRVSAPGLSQATVTWLLSVSLTAKAIVMLCVDQVSVDNYKDV